MSVSLYSALSAQEQSAIAVVSGGALIVLSHAIEDAAQQLPGVALVAGFQRYSNFLTQERRYRRLAAEGHRIWICGVPDVAPPQIQGVQFVSLRQEQPIAREWFVVVNAPGFCTALLASEQTVGLHGAARRFNCALSSEPDTVDLVTRRLNALLRIPLALPAERDYRQQQRQMALVARRLIHHQDQQMARAARQRQHFSALRESLIEQVHEMQTLSALMPHFNQDEQWQRLLLVHIRRAADRLIDRMP